MVLHLKRIEIGVDTRATQVLNAQAGEGSGEAARIIRGKFGKVADYWKNVPYPAVTRGVEYKNLITNDRL